MYKIVKYVIGMFMCCVLLMGNEKEVKANVQCDSDIERCSDQSFKELVSIIEEFKRGNQNLEEAEIVVHLNSFFNGRSKISDIWKSLTESEKRLVVRYPLDALQVNTAKNIAINQTEEKFGYNGLGDKSDAFRHGMWNAEMTIMVGADKAELFANAHEDKDTTGMESDGHTKFEHMQMDLHNNKIGRQFGIDYGSLDEDGMALLLYSEVDRENTLFVWLN